MIPMATPSRSAVRTPSASVPARPSWKAPSIWKRWTYTIVYDFGGGGATDVALTAGNNTDVAGTKAKTGGLGVAISIGVKYDGTAVLLSPDAYSDTIVITVTAVP